MRIASLVFEKEELKRSDVYGGGLYYSVIPATITFSDGSRVEFVMEENPACSVYNYADITPINDEDWRNIEFESWQVEPKEDGFLLSLRIDDLHSRSIYIPCYSDQNGFYSDEVIAVVYDKSGNAINKLTTRGYAL